MASDTSTRAPERTRRAIIASATRLFGERGFDGTSVQEIVRHAGVTKGALYHHFRSKDEILRLIHDQFIDFELREANEIVARRLPPPETLALVMELLVDSVERYLDSMTIFFRERDSLSADTIDEMRPKRDALENIVVRVLEEGIADGSLRPQRNLRVSAFGIIGICVWAYQWYRREGSLRGREVGRIYAAMLLDGLTARVAPTA
jgi:TetR/AcrR family transcriptional regulator, cholesterol catabolism regulator